MRKFVFAFYLFLSTAVFAMSACGPIIEDGANEVLPSSSFTGTKSTEAEGVQDVTSNKSCSTDSDCYSWEFCKDGSCHPNF